MARSDFAVSETTKGRTAGPVPSLTNSTKSLLQPRFPCSLSHKLQSQNKGQRAYVSSGRGSVKIYPPRPGEGVATVFCLQQFSSWRHGFWYPSPLRLIVQSIYPLAIPSGKIRH